MLSPKEQKAKLQTIIDTVNTAAIDAFQTIRIQYVANQRKTSWLSYQNGLVCYVRIGTGFYKSVNDTQTYFEELFAKHGVKIRGMTFSEKTVKGSGFRSARGRWIHASVESTTLVFWVSVE